MTTKPKLEDDEPRPRATTIGSAPLTSWGTWEARLKAERQSGGPRYLQNADVPAGGLVGRVTAITEQRVSMRDFASGSARWVRRERPVLWAEFEGLGRRGVILDGQRLHAVSTAIPDARHAAGRVVRVTLVQITDDDGTPTRRKQRVITIDRASEVPRVASLADRRPPVRAREPGDDDIEDNTPIPDDDVPF